VIQSAAERDFAPEEIKTGTILFKDNTFERACLLKNDCAGVRVLGTSTHDGVFRDLLFVGNVLRDTFGWSWVAEQRGKWTSAQIPGAGGVGIYLDHASGVYAYRNILYNNGFAGFHLTTTWRDGEIVIFNNVSADNAWGLHFGGLAEDLYPAVDTDVRGNLFVNNKAYGVKMSDLDFDYTNITIDRNLYFRNGWGDHVYKPGAMKIAHDGPGEFFPTVEDIAARTPFESAGQEVNPGFVGYNVDDHDPFDGSFADFRLWSSSSAIDAGPRSLPPSLSGLLVRFGIFDPPLGAAYDQGAFEGGVPCDDVVVEAQTVTDTEHFQVCGRLTLGPDLMIAPGGELLAFAGETIVFTNGVTVSASGALEAGAGLFSAPLQSP
jgi:hypothetical protein